MNKQDLKIIAEVVEDEIYKALGDFLEEGIKPLVANLEVRLEKTITELHKLRAGKK